MIPHFPMTVQYWGSDVPITPDPLVPPAVNALRSVAAGYIEISHLGILVLALGWQGVAPWTQVEEQALKAAIGRREALRAELQGSESLRTEPALRAQVERDFRASIGAVREAEDALQAARILDLPVTASARAQAAARVQASLLAGGVPAQILAQWASDAVNRCAAIAAEGWERWSQMEASGFSTAPAGISSSGASESPAPTQGTPSAGSP